MIETILLVFLVAKLKGYKLKPLFKSWTIYPIVLFSFIFIYFQWRIFQADYSLVIYANIFKIAYLLSFIFLVIQYKLFMPGFIGSLFVIAGSILNTVAMRANNSKMPAYPTLSYITGYMKPYTLEVLDNIHVRGTALTKLVFLTDYIDLGYNILSIGDVLVRVFAFIVIYYSIKKLNILVNSIDQNK